MILQVLSSVFCLSVVFGNISLKYIPVSFNQAISATTPFFTAVGSFFILKKRESAATYATLIPVVGGIVVASRFEPSFDAVGFMACLLATSMRALKSILQVSFVHAWIVSDCPIQKHWQRVEVNCSVLLIVGLHGTITHHHCTMKQQHVYVCPPCANSRVTPVGLFVGHAAARLGEAGEHCTLGSHGPDIHAAPASLAGILRAASSPSSAGVRCTIHDVLGAPCKQLLPGILC